MRVNGTVLLCMPAVIIRDYVKAGELGATGANKPITAKCRALVMGLPTMPLLSSV